MLQYKLTFKGKSYYMNVNKRDKISIQNKAVNTIYNTLSWEIRKQPKSELYKICISEPKCEFMCVLKGDIVKHAERTIKSFIYHNNDIERLAN